MSAKFFKGLFDTDIRRGELLREVRLPLLPVGAGWSFQEVARRHGDFALVAVAVLLLLDSQGLCKTCRITLAGVGDGPVEAVSAEAALTGRDLTDPLAAAACLAESAGAADADVDPPDDIHATAEFRHHLVRVLVHRALTEALERAKEAVSQ